MPRKLRHLLREWFRKRFKSTGIADQTHDVSRSAPLDPDDRTNQPRQGSPRGPSTLGPLLVNLGIDFGTALTKICYRDSALEESGIVTFGGRTAEAAMIPSVVSVTPEGTLLLGDAELSAVRIDYLKMRLASLDLPVGSWPSPDGVDLSSQPTVAALSSWYLASVIGRCQEWISQHEADRFAGREVVWSANVGVPVEYYDSQETHDL